MNLSKTLKVIIAKLEFNSKNKESLLDILSEFLNYGISMYAIFNEILVDMYSTQGMRYIINDINNQISEGKNLSTALGKWYGPKVMAIVQSGEVSDNLSESLKIAKISIDSSNNFVLVFMQTITYSFIVFLGSLGILALFSLKIMPVILTYIKGKTFPAVLSYYISYYNFMMSSKSLITLVIVIGIIIAVVIVIQRYSGLMRDKLDKLPIFSIYRQSVAAMLLEQIGFYFKAHILLDKTIVKIYDSSKSPYLKMHCNRIMARLDKGIDNVAYAFNTGLFDKSVSSVMIAMGKVNRLEEKCGDYAKIIQEDVNSSVKKYGSFCGMTLMILATINITWSIYAMYTALIVIQRY